MVYKYYLSKHNIPFVILKTYQTQEEKRQDLFAWLGLILIPASVHIL